MPKERIPATTQPKHPDKPLTVTTTSSNLDNITLTTGTSSTFTYADPPTYPFEVVVSWGNKHPSVTLATVNTEEDPFDPLSGWHVQLTRSEVNRLITTLRRARDKAFGKDA